MSDNVIAGFDGRRIAVEEYDDLESFVVGLAENEDGSGESVIFSVSLSPYDEQDRAPGLGAYCISTEWGATAYDALIGRVLQDNVLALTLDAAAAEGLGIPQECHLHLDADQDSVIQLKASLQRVFATGRTSPANLSL